MPLDSESRWKLVRRLKASGEPPVEGEIVIRAATSDDMLQVAEIYNYYVRNSVVTFDLEPLGIDEWKSKFEHLIGMKLPFIVAVSPNAQILGFAYVAPWRQKAAYRRTVEDRIYLKPAAIGKRLGSRLLETLMRESKAAGVKEIVAVISDKGAEASVALHEAFGFKHQGHLAKVGFKFGRWLGTVLMQKSL